MQTLQKLLTTADASKAVVCQDQVIMRSVTQMLLEVCKLPDLVMISGALDAFFDIFAEDYYNYALAEADVIQQM